jgi:hypothetical protein
MMNRRNTSQTMTVQQIQRRCNTVVLRLTNPEHQSARSGARALVNNARKTVDARFHALVEKNVIDKDQNINPKLLHALETSENSENSEQFLEAFIVGLYRKAVEEEEAINWQLLNDEEKMRLGKLHDKDKDHSHHDDAYKPRQTRPRSQQ